MSLQSQRSRRAKVGKGVDHGVDVDITVASVCRIVRIINRFDRYIRTLQVSGQGVGPDAAFGLGIRPRHDSKVNRVYQPRSALAGRCVGGYPGIPLYRHLRSRGLDETAIAAVGCTGIQPAANNGFPLSHVGHEQYFPLLVHQCLGLNNAAVVHHGTGQAVCRPGGHHHHAAISLDQPPVLGQRVNCTLFDTVLHEAVADKIEGNLVASCHDHTSVIGGDAPFVDHPRAEKSDIAAIG